MKNSGNYINSFTTGLHSYIGESVGLLTSSGNAWAAGNLWAYSTL
jgi:hypothetical protein